MFKFFLAFQFVLPFIQSAQISLICITLNVSLALSTNCSDLNLFKLQPEACDSYAQPITIDDSEIEILHFQGIPLVSLPLSSLSEAELKEFAPIYEYVILQCPSFFENAKSFSFLEFRDQKTDPYGIDMVYLRMYNSTGMSGNTGIYQDFFQKSPLVNQYEFEAPFNFSMDHLVQNFKVFKKNANYTVSSMKLYSQYCGPIPVTPILIEDILAKENPMTHTLTLTILKYFVLKEPFPDNITTAELHELFEVCLRSPSDPATHHVLIDRVAKGKGLLEMWNSVIRVNYLGADTSCDLNSNQWADSRDGSCDGGKSPCLIARAQKRDMHYSINKILRICENFLLKFKIFNSLYNCQHFATDTWDMVNDEKLDFENWELMTVHSKFSGLKPSLEFIDEPNEL